ncbi:MAG: divalent-cation tolerance protein CutA [Verrucomicrobiae bacterium]|nr:divalent-cation tolerance protein CutA [Verrucomicrobiae bacterium]
MSAIAVVMTTVAKRAEARKLAERAVRGRLAACAQIVPGLESLYSWKGKIERSDEFLILLKTTKKALPALLRGLKATHPYETPELVVWSVQASKGYAAWVKEQTRGRAKRTTRNTKRA